MGAQSLGEEQSPPKTSVTSHHLHPHNQVQHLPGGSELWVGSKKNADGQVVVLLNSSWYVVDHLFNKFCAVVVETGELMQRSWRLCILRKNQGRQEGLHVELLRDISNPLPHSE